MGDSALPEALELDFYHQMLFSVELRTPLFVVVGEDVLLFFM